METDRLILRALEPYDINILYSWENDSRLWETTSAIGPFSKENLKDYVNTYNPDIFAARQLRLVIVLKDKPDNPIGAIDIYDFDPINRRAMVGYFIDSEYRNQGIATDALLAVADYCRNRLGMQQIAAVVSVENKASRKLLEKTGFVEAGILSKWLIDSFGRSIDAVICQKIL